MDSKNNKKIDWELIHLNRWLGNKQIMNPNSANIMGGYPSYLYNQNYPSLTNPDEPSTANDQEELAAIIQYIKDLRIPEKR